MVIELFGVIVLCCWPRHLTLSSNPIGNGEFNAGVFLRYGLGNPSEGEKKSIDILYSSFMPRKPEPLVLFFLIATLKHDILDT